MQKNIQFNLIDKLKKRKINFYVWKKTENLNTNLKKKTRKNTFEKKKHKKDGEAYNKKNIF